MRAYSLMLPVVAALSAQDTSSGPRTEGALSAALGLEGRLVLEDRRVPPEPVPVHYFCQGSSATLWTDAKGRFSIPLGQQFAQVSGVLPWLGGCRVAVRLSEYREIVVTLDRARSPADLDLGDLVLRPAAGKSGNTFSSTSQRAPDASRRLFIQALEQIGEKDYNEAIALLDRAIIKYPKYAAAYQLKGQLFDRAGKRELARTAYESAASIDPAYLKPLIQLAELAAEDQNPGEALRWAMSVNKLAPGAYPDMYLLEGASYYNLDRFDESERAARAGIKADPGGSLPRLHKLLGEVLYRKHDYSGALSQFEEYLRVAPKASDAAEVQGRADSCRNLARILQR